jgi:ATP-dependent DNA helicase DinG
MSDLKQTMRRLWEAACRDASLRPSCQVADGYFVFTITGNRVQWETLCATAGVPPHADQQIAANTLTCRWPSHADRIFGARGLLTTHFGPGYEVRLPQLHMARLVQRAIEMDEAAVVEAGTGVGKSFAYAAICLAMHKRVIISTSNKNLQMQLYRKDLPLLQALLGGTVALAVGKANYACRAKAEDSLNRTVQIKDSALRQWYADTATGNTEEITFAVNWQDLSEITVDDECTGKHCPLYYDCFYYAAKAARAAADVIITNHALLCLHTRYPEAGILPPAAVIVVDEAHKLPDYARSTLGFETTLGRIQRAIRKAQHDVDPAAAVFTQAETAAVEFGAELLALIPPADKELQSGLYQDLQHGPALSTALQELADEIWPAADLPTTGDETKRARRAATLRTLTDNLTLLMTANPGQVRWLEPDRQDRTSVATLKLCAMPHDVASFIGQQLIGYGAPTAASPMPHQTHCRRCGRELTAATVHVLDGAPYDPDCIRQIDVCGDAEVMPLAAWLAATPAAPEPEPMAAPQTPVVFCSATLAAPDLAHFLRTCGLPDALQLQATSPFDYTAHTLLYVPNGSSPLPSSPEYPNWLLDQLEHLVRAARGGTFLLFTSYAMLHQAVHTLRPSLIRLGLTTLVQGELPKLEIAQRFCADGNAVLFATKSFFEGVSIDGAALRLVVVDKLPFEAPSPLSRAMEAQALDQARAQGLTGVRLERYPFEVLAVPRMTIELKQALGRLIRTQTDTGVMAMLDTRLRTTQYGRQQVLPALPPAPLTADLHQVRAFFNPAPPPTPALAIAPLPHTVATEDWP